MNVPVPAKRVTIVLGHRPGASNYLEILRRLSAEGATNVVVLRTGAAIDAQGDIESDRPVELVVELPVVIVWVDRPDNVDRILPHIESLASHALITIDDTSLIPAADEEARAIPPAITVGDVMTKQVVTVAPGTELSEVIRTLLARGLRGVPVVDDTGHPVGMITNGDLVRRGGLKLRLELLEALESSDREAAVEAVRADNLHASDVLTPDPVTTTADATLRRASELMLAHQVKRLPVVDEEGAIVGIISRVDILRAVAPAGPTAAANGEEHAPFTGETLAGAIMSHTVPTVTPQMAIPQVLRILTATRLNRAIVVDEQRRVLGVVHDTEVLRRLTPGTRPGALTHLFDRLPFHRDVPGQDSPGTAAREAADLMQTDQLLVHEDTPIRDVLSAMLARNEKMAVVVNARDELVGVIDRADLLRGIMLGERR